MSGGRGSNKIGLGVMEALDVEINARTRIGQMTRSQAVVIAAMVQMNERRYLNHTILESIKLIHMTQLKNN